jgi:molybdenum cofactor cytidylyltransferase
MRRRALTRAAAGAILQPGAVRTLVLPDSGSQIHASGTFLLYPVGTPVIQPSVSIAGIVLAAGRSRRMGASKALLPLDGRTFLERVLDALASGGCEPLLVVVGVGEHHARAADLAGARGAEVVVNPDAESEQIDSLRLALARLAPGTEAAMVTPVDIPNVSSALVAALISSFRRTGAPLALPRHDGRHGHPVLFGESLFEELSRSDHEDGARGVVHAHLHRAAFVDVEDPDAFDDVDTPAAYRRLRET